MLKKLGKILCWFLGIIGITLLAVILTNWGYWETPSEKLFGVNVPIDSQFHTDTSERGREAGFFVAVYTLPDDLISHLQSREFDIRKHPKFRFGYDTDGYTRVTWTHEFPRNRVEQHLFDQFAHDGSYDLGKNRTQISTDEEALALANRLMAMEETFYAGWYRNKQGSEDRYGFIWIPDYYIYILNINEKVMVKIGLQT